LSPESVSIQIERELKKRAVEIEDDEAFVISAHPDVAAYLIGGGGQTAQTIEKQVHHPVYIRANHEMHIENYDIVTGDIQEMEEQMLPYKKSQQVECEVVRISFVSLPRSAAWANGYLIDLSNGGKYIGQRVKARLTKVHRSYAQGDVIGPVKTPEGAICKA
jgi:predicted PilT family ATPase